MKKQHKAARQRAIRIEQKQRRLEKRKADEAALEALEGDDDIQEGDEVLDLPVEGDEPEESQEGDPAEEEEEDNEEELARSLVEKSYDSAYPEMPRVGPTSFEELDAAREAQEKASKVLHVGYDVQDLVWNIIAHPELEPDDKAKAIEKVGADFRERVATVAQDLTKDIEILELEALIAKEKRQSGVMDFVRDLLAKADLSSAGRKGLSDGQFGLVVNRGGKKVRKYPIHDKAHVRNALARAAQMMKRGGSAAADAKAALPKIRAAAKRMGIGMSKERNAIVVEKDQRGDWRWVGWPSNNYLDLAGDIISKEAHEDYVAWLDSNPELYPAFLTWHTPGTERQNPVDFCMFKDGYLIMSGKLTEEEAASLFRVQKDTDLGMSIGAIGARDNSDPRIIAKYRMFEVSDLPLENAANPFTDFSVIVKEAGMDKAQYLASILGEEKAKAFLEKTQMKQQVLEQAKVESKEQPAPTPETPPTPAPAPASSAEDVVKKVLETLDVEGLNDFLTKAQEAMEKVPVLEELVRTMQSGQDERLAEMIKPPASRFVWARKERASGSTTNVVKSDSPEAKAAPGVPDDYWLSQVTGTRPVDSEAVPQ